MGPSNRCREPEVWQHVMIRGTARRSICDRDEDAERLFHRVNLSVDRGDLRVAAFCLMPNHAHLIVRSPSGRLGDAMRDVESCYVRDFNRPRDRLGTLVQARYKAKPIRSPRYMTAAIAYTDLNPVEAGLVATPADYPHGSARFYAQMAGPAWLDRSWVEAYLRAGREVAPYDPSLYARVFGTRTSAGARRWMVAAMESPLPDTPALEVLIAASPDHILRWMEEQARNADGTGRTIPLVDAQTIGEVVLELPLSERMRPIGRGKQARSLERVLLAGLLRRVGGLTVEEIGRRTCLSTSGARLAVLEHDRAMVEVAVYRDVAGRVSRAALDACHPRLVAND